MEVTRKDTRKKENPVRKANLLSQLFFLYLFPIFRRTLKKNLTEDDMFDPLPEHESMKLGNKLERIWKEEFAKSKKYALHRSFFRMFGFRFMLIGLFRVANEIMVVVLIPLSIGKVVSFYKRGQTKVSQSEVYIYASIIIIVYYLSAVCTHPTLMAMMHMFMKMRLACSSLMYRKALKLSMTSMRKTTVGNVVNLLSNDVNKFEQDFILAHYIWMAPIQAAVGTYMIYTHIGVSALFGIAFLLSFIPLQIYIGKRISVIRLKSALRTDERVRLMNEIISGMQVIKMYCWEKPFSHVIALARRKEMNSIRSYLCYWGTIMSFALFATRVAIFLSVLGYILLGNYIDAEKVFAITAIYSILRPTIGFFFATSISCIAQVIISLNRIQHFLAQDEHTVHRLEHIECNGNDSLEIKDLELNSKYFSSKVKIELRNVSAKWIRDSESNTLVGIDLEVDTNQLIAVIGPVGSGKTSLLNVLLNELIITKGEMKIKGTISYSTQEPWLFSGSVRQNILFGEDYDEEHYNNIIKFCALQSDFDLFQYGDRTLVGEKGKSLSGGQKARINLARCIYKKADVYLLDDPLSAVDSKVGKHLYEECIRKYLSNKTCILVTHQIQYLQNADTIIIMKDKQIEQRGSYDSLQTGGLQFAKLLEKSTEEDEEATKKVTSSRSSSVETNDDTEEIEPLLEKEVLTQGKVKLSTYWGYVKAGGGPFAIFLLVATFLGSCCIIYGGDYFVRCWVNMEQDFAQKIANNTLYDGNQSLARDFEMVYVYSGIITLTVISSVGHCLYFVIFLSMASTNLHNNTFNKLIKATMKFFDNNPSGRILNRFSKDLGTIDEYLPMIAYDVLYAVFLLLAAIILSIIIEIWLLIPSLIITVLFYYLRSIYIKTSRSVKRIEGITRSPIYGHMTTSMLGLTTIRALKAEKMLIREFDSLQDKHSGAWYLYLASNRGFGLWIDLFCISFTGVAVVLLIFVRNHAYGGDIGMIITQYIGLMGSMQWGMRQWSELENQITSVERVLEYTKIESEPKRIKMSLDRNWPEHGRLEFKNISLCYHPNDYYVLKDLSFVVEPKQKIGIVGRTGAGKSSTITVLFQLYETEGSIEIDGVDTTKMPLEDIRNKISIIPQEPVLFSGTMRKNLDPFDEFDDQVLWNALAQVELKNAINNKNEGLNALVSEGGSNFSIGERQLVCLARALIRNNKILVLDEATANVDPGTDALIQKTIRTKFSECTVLTIAHRLHTVMDSDKILVMDSGEVKEYDHPYILLQNEKGFLRSLVDSTGSTTATKLEKSAKDSYRNRTRVHDDTVN